MAKIQKKMFNSPDDKHTFDKATVEVVKLGGVTVRRLTFQPGWRWTTSVKPVVKTDLCENAHLNVHITGRLRVKMRDGSEGEYGPGDVVFAPSGHNAWVVGDEPNVLLEMAAIEKACQIVCLEPVTKEKL